MKIKKSDKLNFNVVHHRYACLVSEVLFELMEKHGINRQQLADTTGVPYTTLQGWTESAEPKVQDNLIKIAKFFNVSLEYLCYGIGLDEDDYERLLDEKEKRIKELEMQNYFLEAEKKNQQIMPFMESKNEVFIEKEAV